jgi:hypothetical protein
VHELCDNLLYIKLQTTAVRFAKDFPHMSHIKHKMNKNLAKFFSLAIYTVRIPEDNVTETHIHVCVYIYIYIYIYIYD